MFIFMKQKDTETVLWVLSRALRWENKTYKLKRSIEKWKIWNGEQGFSERGESITRITSHSDFLLCDESKRGHKKEKISKLRIF